MISYKINNYHFEEDKYDKDLNASSNCCKKYKLVMYVTCEFYDNNKYMPTSSPEVLASILNVRMKPLLKLLKVYNKDIEFNTAYKIWFSEIEQGLKFCDKYLLDKTMINKFIND